MFENIEFKSWKKSFYFETTPKDLLRVKYSHKWYFPLMFSMLSILLFSFAVFIIVFFMIDKTVLALGISYMSMILVYITCWVFLFCLIQKRALYPHKRNSRGNIIFSNEEIIVEKKNSQTTIPYSGIKGVYVNKKTGALLLLDKNKSPLFIEIMKNEDIHPILKILYKTTKIKPNFI
jgi:hypothetical protein